MRWQSRTGTAASGEGFATWLTQRTVWLVFTFVLTRMPNSKGEIRCYCNIPVCVSTGYMCKSTQGVCFSEQFGYSKDLSQSRHGCVELLHHHHQREMCEEQTRTGRVTVGVFPALLCCSEDMCNYVSKMDINIQVHSKSNGSYAPGLYGYSDGSFYYSTTGHEGALHQDLWFKAAVIAVPIAGGFILILLIVLAVRLLRQDAKRQRHLVELRRQRQFKTHLLGGAACNPHFVATNANPVNLVEDKECVYDSKHCGTNLAMSNDSFHFDNTKQYNRPTLLYNSVISWGKWNSTTLKSSSLV